MTDKLPQEYRPYIRSALATPTEIAHEPPPFPSTSEAMPCESAFPDWRERLTRNLTRRGDGRWEPLTYVHEKPSAGLPVNGR
ncbi:MAG TPA: hypothetical protein VGM82_24105 [Gemmatimonadaceae bacterium]|jgi:hypothetical protein